MAINYSLDRMRGREIVHALSVMELLSLAVWCILALIFKLVNLGFAGLDRILGKRFDEVLAPLDTDPARNDVRPGEVASSVTTICCSHPVT